MKLSDVFCYLQKLFENHILVALSAVGAFLCNFLFPTHEYEVAAVSVMAIMVLDVLTKIYSLARQEGSLRKAISLRKIKSEALAKGTMDKLVVFGVMLIICGLLYNMSIISDVAIWFTQVVFILMFLRDLLSILENLSDAGIDVGIYKYIVKKKMKEYVCEEEVEKLSKKGEQEAPKPEDQKEDTSAQG